MTGAFELQRFLDAQQSAGTYDRALAELHAGRKRTHWMWFVFPQLAGLGRSAMAQRYAIGSLDQARAYLAHPVLGPRLRACVEALLDLPTGASAREILGDVDALKLHSSLTLFSRAAPGDRLFPAALDRYFHGEPDQATDDLLRSSGEATHTL